MWLLVYKDGVMSVSRPSGDDWSKCPGFSVAGLVANQKQVEIQQGVHIMMKVGTGRVFRQPVY